MNQGRADEAFTKYGPWVGNRDDLAWVYIIDKDIGFAFNTVNDPTPAGSVMEDGESRTVSKKYNKQPDDQQKICSTMNHGFDMISQLLLPEGTRKGEETDGLERIDKALALVERLERQIKSQRKQGNERKGKALCMRIKILEAALVKAYTAIGGGGVLGGDMSDDDSSSSSTSMEEEASQNLLHTYGK